jgi:hypothetical protein
MKGKIMNNQQKMWKLLSLIRKEETETKQFKKLEKEMIEADLLMKTEEGWTYWFQKYDKPKVKIDLEKLKEYL